MASIMFGIFEHSAVGPQLRTGENIIHIYKKHGRVITLDFEPTLTIDGLKAKIQDRTEIPSDRQVLHVGRSWWGFEELDANVLKDGDRTLSDYGIENESALRLSVHLKLII